MESDVELEIQFNCLCGQYLRYAAWATTMGKMWDNLWLFFLDFIFLFIHALSRKRSARERKREEKRPIRRKAKCVGSNNSLRDRRERMKENV